MKQAGLRPRLVVVDDEVSLYAERHLLSVFSVYVVHASLLLILAGGIVDAIYGYHGYLTLNQGQSTDQVELHTGVIKKMPFALRCDGAGQENYADGSPKKYWSDLVVLENGREVLKKQIIVNDPLVTHGIRFYQSGFGQSGELEKVRFAVTLPGGPPTEVIINGQQPSQLADGSTLRVSAFIPDAAIRGNEIYAKSNNLANPTFELSLTSAKTAAAESIWLTPSQQATVQSKDSGITISISKFEDIQTLPFTGLQVSHEPGQWAVWGGCILMAVGLIMAFYLVHQRYWAVAFEDAKTGGTVLWLGTSADKNREHFQESFDELTEKISEQVIEPARELTHV